MSQLPEPPLRPRHRSPAWVVALCVLVPACDSSQAEDSSPEANTPLRRIETTLKGKVKPQAEPVVVRSIEELDPMPAATFEALVASIQAETFNDLRAKLARAGAKEHRMSSAQIAKLVASMPFSQTRIEVAQALYPYALDRARYAPEVLAVTRFESEREVLRKWIEAQTPATPPVTPSKKRR